MRKKISLLLCVAAVMLFTAACADSSQETVDYNEATIQQTAEFMMEYCANADDATLKQWRSMREFAMELQLTQAGLPVHGRRRLMNAEHTKATGTIRSR